MIVSLVFFIGRLVRSDMVAERRNTNTLSTERRVQKNFQVVEDFAKLIHNSKLFAMFFIPLFTQLQLLLTYINRRESFLFVFIFSSVGHFWDGYAR